ncbi:MAG TPA: ATP-binding protein [Planctomycetota bacterium]|nr:ATP-binding protein [Planctomycetota bacterium]
MRLAVQFAGLFALLALALSALAVSLVGGAVRDRVQGQLRDTAELLAKMKLTNETARLLALVVHADVVVSVGDKVEISSQDGAAPGDLLESLVARVADFTETREHLVVSTPIANGRRLWLLYPRELEREEKARAVRPAILLSVVGVALAALLGAVKERSAVAERTRALERLVSALAHEVKNPLGAIRLTVETLREGATERDREAFDVVTGEVERLALLVDELRLLGGPQRFAPEATDPARSVDEVLALLRRTLEHRGLGLDRQGTAPRALVDPRALKQALLNLLLNAIEASPRGATVHVRLGGTERPRIEVQDEGPGVPLGLEQKIFEPFFTTKEGGTGLGLALARRVAKESGGSLELARGERGATFVLELLRA